MCPMCLEIRTHVPSCSSALSHHFPSSLFLSVITSFIFFLTWGFLDHLLDTFLVTHLSFTTSCELLQLFIKSYHAAQAQEQALDMGRIVGMIKHWFVHFPWQFTRDPKVRQPEPSLCYFLPMLDCTWIAFLQGTPPHATLLSRVTTSLTTGCGFILIL